MKIADFINDFNAKKIMNTKAAPNAVSEYLNKTLNIKTYIPFKEKRLLAETIVQQNTTEVEGVKRNDSINQYIAFVCSMLVAHTNLEFGEDPVEEYDMLASSGLLPAIISEFQESYNECEAVLKMALAMELEDNNINVLVGKFLNGILQRIDGVGEILKDKFDNFELKDILGADFKPEDLAKLSGLLDKFK